MLNIIRKDADNGKWTILSYEELDEALSAMEGIEKATEGDYYHSIYAVLLSESSYGQWREVREYKREEKRK